MYGNRTATNISRCIQYVICLFVCLLVRLESNLDVGFEGVMWRDGFWLVVCLFVWVRKGRKMDVAKGWMKETGVSV